MSLAFDSGLGFIQAQDLQRLGLAINRLSQELCCLNTNFCKKVNVCIAQPVGQIVYGTGTGITSNAGLFYGTNPSLFGNPNVGFFSLQTTNGLHSLIANNIQGADEPSNLETLLAVYNDTGMTSGTIAGYKDSRGFYTNQFINFTNGNTLQVWLDSTNGFSVEVGAPGIIKAIAVDYSSNIRFGKYLNTRDNSGSVVPRNFLYTDGTGNLLSANIQVLLAVLPNYANNAAAVAGGVSVGWSYYNTTTNTYTRVI